MTKKKQIKNLESELKNALIVIQMDKKIICDQAIEIMKLKYKLNKALENKTQNNNKEWSNLEEI